MSFYEQVPAAEYVRISTGHQECSIANQKRLISEYARQHGFEVVRTYIDIGKSGVTVQNRSGLGELLRDVLAGSLDFKAILVYDVSRWGRFQDADEAAHYEFLCRSAGVAVRYCAEPFGEAGSFLDQLMKVLKRTMAAEYSRELGVKVHAGQKKLAQLGFRVGGPCGYGLSRLMVSKDRTAKTLLAKGEIKNLSTDHVVLVPGPSNEVACVREMYEMFLDDKMTFAAIARRLNSEGQLRGDYPWTGLAVRRLQQVRNTLE